MLHVHEPVNPMFGVSKGNGRIIILGVPMEDTLSFKPGTRFAPMILRQVTPYLEATPTEWLGYEPLSELNDLGDVSLHQGDVNFNLDRIRSVANELLGKGLLINVGGEHTVSLAMARAIRDKFNELGAFIQFDAHLDLRSEWPIGQGLSHATFARILNNEVKPSLYVNLGFRGFDEEELNYARGLNSVLLDSVELSMIKYTQLHDLLKTINDTNGPIHLSIDIDVFDPSIAPGVGNPEAGGVGYMTIYKALEVVMPLIAGRLVAIDVVEYSPPNDVSNITASLVAKLIVDLMNLYLWSINCRQVKS